MDYALRTFGLSKRYDYTTALDGVSVNIPSGAIYGLVGRNGAGKTTLIRLLTGLQSPSEGGYELFGVNSSSKNIRAERRRIGATVESPALYLNMSAKDNLAQQCMLLGIEGGETIDAALRTVGLAEAGKKAVKDFSLGMRGRLGIAMALIGNPDIVILDEPLNGLDPYGIIEMRELIVRLKCDMGITFLISSHLLDELAKIATHYGFLDGGRLIRECEANEVLEQSQRSARVEVSDIGALVRALNMEGIEYRIASDKEADILTDMSITKLALLLNSEGCELFKHEIVGDSLEGYFINLTGGDVNA